MMEQVHQSEAGQDHKPEPKEHIDPLVQDVDRENTLDIMPLSNHSIQLNKVSIEGAIPVLIHLDHT
jgi:hypothetical protein